MTAEAAGQPIRQSGMASRRDRAHFDLDLPEPVVTWASMGGPQQKAAGASLAGDA